MREEKISDLAIRDQLFFSKSRKNFLDPYELFRNPGKIKSFWTKKQAGRKGRLRQIRLKCCQTEPKSGRNVVKPGQNVDKPENKVVNNFSGFFFHSGVDNQITICIYSRSRHVSVKMSTPMKKKISDRIQFLRSKTYARKTEGGLAADVFNMGLTSYPVCVSSPCQDTNRKTCQPLTEKKIRSRAVQQETKAGG